LLRVICLSDASPKLDELGLRAIQSSASRFNEAHGIRGVLLYGCGRFLHVLDGEARWIESVLIRTRRDERHYDMRVLARHGAGRHLYEAWSMGVLNEDPPLARGELIDTRITELAERLGSLKSDEQIESGVRRMIEVFVELNRGQAGGRAPSI
jgi:hypothetical protein